MDLPILLSTVELTSVNSLVFAAYQNAVKRQDETAAAVLDGALEKLQRELAGRLQAQDVELKEVNRMNRLRNCGKTRGTASAALRPGWGLPRPRSTAGSMAELAPDCKTLKSWPTCTGSASAT